MIEESKHYALAITCGAKRGPKDSDLIFSPASLRDFLKALEPQPAQPEQEPVALHRDLHSHMMVVAHRAANKASENVRKHVSQKRKLACGL